MTPRARVLAWCALASALAAAPGCDDPNVCAVRGGVRSMSGSAAYAGQYSTSAEPPAPTGGALLAAMNIDDFAPNGTCDVLVTFTVRVGDACTLWMQQTGDDVAEVQPDQPCTLPLSSGTVSIVARSGALKLDPPKALLVVSGDVTRYGDLPASGFMQWRFDGT